jgi:fructoselysine 6-kinase
MRHVDVAFLSAPDRDDESCAALLAWCASQGSGVAVATRGTHGAMARAGGRTLWQSSHPVVPVDTLGAGDGFIAAFLVAHATGCPLAECLERGAAHAATVCGMKGAFGHGAAVRPGQPGLEPVPAAPVTRTA